MTNPTYRQVWENHHNKKIPKGWHIHHWDGDHNNNRVGNLFCCSPEDHWLIHWIQGDPIAFHGKWIQGASEAGKRTKGIPKSEEHKQALRKPKSNTEKMGKWVRTEEHRKEQSLRKQGKYIGEDNPFYGKKHKPKSMEQRTETRRRLGIKPKFTGKGCRWYTNGLENTLCLPENIPVGFYLGQTRRRK